MSLKYSSAIATALALATGSLAGSPAIAAPAEVPVLQKYKASTATAGRYVVKLADGITARAMLDQLRAVDGSATLLRESKLIPGLAWFELSDSGAELLSSSDDVRHHGIDEPSVKESGGDAGLHMIDNALAAATAAAEVPPLSSNPEAGKGVRVAVVSSGVDYTHALLGGPGTAEAYADALANRSNAYDGFPTEVVVGGYDARSEDGVFDPNPIENAATDVDPSRSPVPIGRGTMISSIVHELAPGAELLAYKIYSINSDGNGNALFGLPVLAVIDEAFAKIVDPNGDGDTSDRPDIVLMDTTGGAAFYHPFDETTSANSLFTSYVQALAAHDILVVSNTGTFNPKGRYGIGWIGAAPDALTVGGMDATADGPLTASGYSARGPVRGFGNFMKPDLVSYAFGITGAKVGTADGTVTESSNDVAAARIAAAAAILKSERPQLSALDVKTLLANTANSDILASRDPDSVQADLPLIGMGHENLATALSMSSLVRSEDGNQPAVNFGFQEFAQTGTITRNVVIRNLGNERNTFVISHDFRGDKESHAALTLDYPASVEVPPMQQVTVPVSITVDPAKLQDWPLRRTGDYSDANWSAVQLNGDLTFTSMIGGDVIQGDLSLGWMITPRAKTVISQDFATLQELLEIWGQPSPPELALADDFVEWGAVGYSMEFSNIGAKETGFAALPMITHLPEIPNKLKNSHGQIMRYLSGGVFPEAACGITGQKLVMGVTMDRSSEVPMAKHFERGDHIFSYSLFPRSTVENYGLDDSIGNGFWMQWLADEEFLTSAWVAMDSNGQPVTIYVDYNLPYDWTNPTGRWKKSTLPTYFSTHSRNVISQVCVEDILHHRMTPEILNDNIGIVAGTDRSTFPDVYQPIIQVNPTRYGYMVDCDEWGCWYNDGAKVTLEPAPTEGEPAFNHMLDVPVGGTVKLTAVKEDVCDAIGFLGNPPPPCNRRFMLMGLEGDYALASDVRLGGDESVVARPRSGQEFTVAENAEAGTVVGRIELEADGFFALGDQPGSQWNDFSIILESVIPGAPFVVHTNGDITVSNPAAIDYEQQTMFTLQVRTQDGFDTSRAVDVTVHVSNINDVAPEYLGGLDNIEVRKGEFIELDIAGRFDETEGDPMGISVSGYPDGMSFDVSRGMLKGIPEKSGDHPVTVVASDGVHDTTVEFMIKVTKPGGGGGAGSIWLLLMLLALRPAISRRRFTR